jgi:hypothetical protein
MSEGRWAICDMPCGVSAFPVLPAAGALVFLLLFPWSISFLSSLSWKPASFSCVAPCFLSFTVYTNVSLSPDITLPFNVNCIWL